MFRTFVVSGLALALVLGAGCWENKVKRLSDAEFDHYYALRPYMSDDLRKEFLRLKTEDERNAWLKSQGLWDRFYQYSAAEREAIVAGEVAVGWSKDKLLMSWGAPYDKRQVASTETYRSELYVYRFEQLKDGAVLVYEPGSSTAYKAVRMFRREVLIQDDVVKDIREYENWS